MLSLKVFIFMLQFFMLLFLLSFLILSVFMCSFLYYIFLCYNFKCDHLSCDNFVIISPRVFLPKTWQTQSSGPDIEALDRRQEKKKRRMDTM